MFLGISISIKHSRNVGLNFSFSKIHVLSRFTCCVPTVLPAYIHKPVSLESNSWAKESAVMMATPTRIDCRENR